MHMTKRLQVLLDDEELAEFQRLARRRRMTTAEWVRRSLRAAHEAEAGAERRSEADGRPSRRRLLVPTGDIDTMLDEIEQGYGELDGS